MKKTPLRQPSSVESSTRRRDRASAASKVRLCLASGEACAEGDLIRFVIGPDDQVVPDIAGKLPGRGLWVRANRADLERAIAQRRFARAARRKVVAPSALVAQVERLLADRCLARLGLSFRSGQLAHGFERVLAEVSAGRASVVITAEDGAASGREKIWKAVRRANGPLGAGCFTRDELGLALGRHNVVHAALSTGRMADKFIEDLRRLQGFRPICPPDWAGDSGTREQTERSFI